MYVYNPEPAVCGLRSEDRARNTHMFKAKAKHICQTFCSFDCAETVSSASSSSGGSIHATTESIKVESALLAKSVEFRSSSIHVWIIVVVLFFSPSIGFHFYEDVHRNCIRNICIESNN